MTEPSSRRMWPRLAAEFVVIVMGVLVALAFDAWVERSADQTREVEALESLASDLTASVADLRGENRAATTQAGILNWFLSFPIDGSEAFPLDSMPSVSFGMHYTSAYSPMLGTYEALIATGRLDLIENTDVQFGLSELRRRTDEYLDFRRQTTDGWLFALRAVWIRWIGDATGPYGASLLPPPPVLDALNDREFRGVVRHRSSYLLFSSQSGERLADHMDTLIALIQAELGVPR